MRCVFFFQAEDGIRDDLVTGVQTCALPISTGEIVVTRDEACKLAEHWIAAWNPPDLDLIMTHYEDAIELTSPVVAQLLGTPDGKVIGKANLKAYFQRGLAAYPELHFRLDDVLLV